MKKDNWIIRTFKNPWYIAAAVTAFISVISFFQINSYWADRHKFNGLFGWLGIGLFFGLAAIYLMFKASKTSTGTAG